MKSYERIRLEELMNEVEVLTGVVDRLAKEFNLHE